VSNFRKRIGSHRISQSRFLIWKNKAHTSLDTCKAQNYPCKAQHSLNRSHANEKRLSRSKHPSYHWIDRQIICRPKEGFTLQPTFTKNAFRDVRCVLVYPEPFTPQLYKYCWILTHCLHSIPLGFETSWLPPD